MNAGELARTGADQIGQGIGTAEPAEVRVGQVWELRHGRDAGRRVRVTHVNVRSGAVALSPVGYGRESWPRLDSFRRRYRLVQDAPEPERADVDRPRPVL